MPTFSSFGDSYAVFRSTVKHLRRSIIVDPDPKAKGAKWRVIDREWDRFNKHWRYRLVAA